MHDFRKIWIKHLLETGEFVGFQQSYLLTDQLLEGLPDCISKAFGVVENPAEKHNREPEKTRRNCM